MERTQQNPEHGRSAEELLAQFTNYNQILTLANELGAEKLIIRRNINNL